MQFEAEAQRALDTASSLGAQYADVRFGESRDEHIEVRNGIVSGISDSDSAGFSVRALVDGAWGFASSAAITNEEIDRIAGLAVGIARASARVKGQGISVSPVGSFNDSYKTPFEIDPASVSLNDRVSHLLAVEQELRAAKGVTVGRAWMDIWRTKKSFASTDGSRIEQELLQCGSALHALAVGESDVQDRIFPGTGGLYQTGGYEIVRKAKLLENARRIGEEAVALLTAEQCPIGDDGHHPLRRPSLAADPRVDRPRAGARSRAGLGSQLLRNVVRHARQVGQLPLWQPARERRLRHDLSARARDARLRR